MRPPACADGRIGDQGSLEIDGHLFDGARTTVVESARPSIFEREQGKDGELFIHVDHPADQPVGVQAGW